jgi:hypothetical protein
MQQEVTINNNTIYFFNKNIIYLKIRTLLYYLMKQRLTLDHMIVLMISAKK